MDKLERRREKVVGELSTRVVQVPAPIILSNILVVDLCHDAPILYNILDPRLGIAATTSLNSITPGTVYYLLFR